MRYVLVPAERMGVVIGPDGATRRLIEKRTGVRIHMDSRENEVQIDDAAPTDPLGPLKAEDVVKAIARGFSPEHAFRLFGEDQYLVLFDIHDYVGKNKSDVRRLAARVIGSEGKTRRIIEDLTGCLLSVYGHSVGLIGEVDELDAAKSAVDMLLSGSEHAMVYRFLESKRREAKRARLEY